jgi:hypothetical protein
MELPESDTLFWSSVVLPNHPCTLTIPDSTDFFLTSVALADDNGEGRVVLNVAVNQFPSVAIAPLTYGGLESATVDVRFSPKDKIVFSLTGAEVSVHIAGYFMGEENLVFENGVADSEGTESGIRGGMGRTESPFR